MSGSIQASYEDFSSSIKLLPIFPKDIKKQRKFGQLVNLSKRSIIGSIKGDKGVTLMLRVSLVFHTIVPLIDLNNVT